MKIIIIIIIIMSHMGSSIYDVRTIGVDHKWTGVDRGMGFSLVWMSTLSTLKVINLFLNHVICKS